MNKPDKLKSLDIITVHNPVPNTIGRFTTKNEIRNKYGETILSDQIPDDCMKYICDTINRDEDSEKQVLCSMVILGKTPIRRETKQVTRSDDGTFILRNTRLFDKWVSYHRDNSMDYTGDNKRPYIKQPCNIKMVFVQPEFEELQSIHDLIDATCYLLKRTRILSTLDSSVVKSFDGSKVIRRTGQKYRTFIEITALPVE